MTVSWCNLYKWLVGLVILLIIMEYIFGTIEYNKHWDTMINYYNSNKTSNETTKSPQHSPLINTLMKHGDVTATSIMTVTPSSDDFANTSTTMYASMLPPLCPETPSDLGNVVPVVKSDAPSVRELEARFDDWLLAGGHSRPTNCTPPKMVAIIVPFRCRAEHLLLFLQHMHPFLRRQQIDYTLFVVELEGKGAFNRASLMNVGFVEAMKLAAYDCFIFHDVDLLPEDERNMYTCPEMPRHMSVAVDVLNYALPYQDIFGGVCAISTEHFRLLNGFSNSFWGWGGEDDDMSNRIRYHHLYISRYPKTIAKYKMLTHKKDKANPERYDMLKVGKLKYDTDGLSNLRYTLVDMKPTKLYTWLLVRLGPAGGSR